MGSCSASPDAGPSRAPPAAHFREFRSAPGFAVLPAPAFRRPAELDRQAALLNERIDALRQRIADEADLPFSPDSPKQLAQVLFNAPDDDPPGLGLKVIKRGKTGPSTDQEVLEKLAGDPEIDSDVPRY